MTQARYVFALLLATQLGACVTPPTPDEDGAPARLIHDPLLTRRNSAASILSIRRDAAATDDACRHRIFLDGNPVADLRPNEFVTIYAPPGQHVLRAEQTGSTCHGGNEIAATTEKGESRTYYTTDPSTNGAVLTATAH